MDNQETPEQARIRQLELELHNANTDISNLIFINTTLGYSTRIMSEFHLSLDDKKKLADAFDSAKNSDEIKEIYDKFNTAFLNKSLNEESSDCQLSPSFKDNLRQYFAVSLGYDIVSEIADNLYIIADCVALKNKIRSTPDLALRQPMTDKLLKDREPTLIEIDNIINIINSFNK